MIPLLFLFVLSASLAFSLQSMTRAGTEAGDLYAIFIDSAPLIDGIVDDIWSNAPQLSIALGETYDNSDPASITDCAGCHSYSSDVDVSLKAVYTTDRLYMLARWPDPTASFTRGGSWSFANGAWEKPNSVQSEDRISFYWPIGTPTGNPYNTSGCMSKCHMYYPTDTDPHVSTHAIVDDAWLESGRADMWHSKAARGAAFLSASGTDLVVDAATHEVTAGTLSMTGYADDKYVDAWADDTVNGEDGGRYGDAGKSAYSHNRIADKSRPKFMEKAPVDYADAMVLTQVEIDDGEVVGDATTGVSDADAVTYWPVYAGFDAVIPERILRQPEGSRASIGFGAVWDDGYWTAELVRDLTTGSDDDVQFDTVMEYPFNVAQFDNARHGYEHRTSANYSLRFVSPTPGEKELFVKRVTSAPLIDGIVDDIWSNAPQLSIALGETYDNSDPASITDCAGCHSYSSDVDVSLKAVYTTDRLYMLARWPDPTASFTRGGSWSFANGAWEKPNSVQSEDRISFYWPIGTPTGNPYNTSGCMSKCHMYYPTDTDPHVSTHAIVDDAWLESGRADMWHSKAARGAAFLSASGTDLVVDAATHEVTAGTLSMTGYADDKYVDAWADDTVNGEDGGRYGDAGKSAYSHNRIADKSRPKFMEKAPVDYADAMVLTQVEIDDGEVVGDATTGVSDADAVTYWPVYAGFDAVIPERILRQPEGSRASIGFGAVWDDGYWTAELVRDLTTGSDDDVQFDTVMEYPFNVAQFDNARHGYEHRTSANYSMRFDLSVVGVDEQQADIPRSFNLAQNYPNPFNPVTTISYELPRTEYVTIQIVNTMGQRVASLVNSQQPPGFHSVQWNALGVGSGTYFYQIIAGPYTAVKSCILLK